MFTMTWWAGIALCGAGGASLKENPVLGVLLTAAGFLTLFGAIAT